MGRVKQEENEELELLQRKVKEETWEEKVGRVERKRSRRRKRTGKVCSPKESQREHLRMEEAALVQTRGIELDEN